MSPPANFSPAGQISDGTLPSFPNPSQNLGCTRGTVSAVLRLYRQADTNKDGHVDLGEFARQFEIERRNPFLPRLVQLFDLSGDGQMSVFEYVVCLSQFGARRGRGDHIYFAWRLFDVDDDGALTKDEFVRVLKRRTKTRRGKVQHRRPRRPRVFKLWRRRGIRQRHRLHHTRHGHRRRRDDRPGGVYGRDEKVPALHVARV